MKRTATFLSMNPVLPHADGRSPVICRKRTAESPSESVIRNLLNYSKALAVLKTTETGFVNLVMN